MFASVVSVSTRDGLRWRGRLCWQGRLFRRGGWWWRWPDDLPSWPCNWSCGLLKFERRRQLAAFVVSCTTGGGLRIEDLRRNTAIVIRHIARITWVQKHRMVNCSMLVFVIWIGPATIGACVMLWGVWTANRSHSPRAPKTCRGVGRARHDAGNLLLLRP